MRARSARPFSHDAGVSYPRLRLGVLALIAVAGMSACTPALDWRESKLGVKASAVGVTMSASDLRAVFPCKPEKFERVLSLVGEAAPSQMHVCKADGLTWSVTRFSFQDPTRMQPALRALRAAQATNAHAQEVGAAVALTLPGMTPSDLSVRVRFGGGTSAGQPVVIDSGWAARGPEVIQISVIKPQAQASAQTDAVDQFFQGVRW